MKKLILMAAAAGCLLTAPALVSAPQALAQSSVTVGPHGVTVRERDHRHWRRHHHRDRCRTVVTRDHRHGRTIISRRRICD
jgi:hypothetical protein